jgi:hypothetical protein
MWKLRWTAHISTEFTWWIPLRLVPVAAFTDRPPVGINCSGVDIVRGG